MRSSSQKTRFIIVGTMNTLIDFGLLFILKTLGLPAIPANIISTGTAFCFSFLASKKYTFKTTDTNTTRELILFIIVTLFGLWVLQTLVIKLCVTLLDSTALSDNTSLLIAKIVATLVSLTWNYVLYSRVVFRPVEPPHRDLNP